MNTRAHVVVSGRVHGVWYRASTCDKAEQLGLGGWVKNRSDGTVEAVFEGPIERVKEMIGWCHHGPPLAEVANVEVTYQEYQGEFAGFSIQY
jgi:acylphosphatase